MGFLFTRTPTCLAQSAFGHRGSRGGHTPDVGKLLYGKRKNAVHRTSTSKPSMVSTLQQTPIEGITDAVRHAVMVNELGREDVLAVLKSNRALHRFDRSEALVKALRAARQPLTEYHYSLLLAHANDDRNSQKANELWKAAAQEGKATDLLHSALLSTFRNDGQWQQALAHCDTMWEDKRRVDAFGLHATMNACRKAGHWEAAMGVFHKAVERGTAPSQVVYLELLRVIHDSSMPDRWRYGLAILEALSGRVDVTAGHYNAVLSMLGGARWEKGVTLFEEMKRRGVQPSRDTLNTLLLLQPHNVTHCIRCVAEAHALSMPVTDSMYRAVISNLFRLELDHEAVQFAEREYQEALNDVGNPVNSTLSLSMALLDAILSHPRPRDALVILKTFNARLCEVVNPAAKGMGVMGKSTQRWMVQGRVAVVDHNVLLSPRFESLVYHYDSILIPYTCVRVLVRRARDQADTPRGRYMRVALLRLRETLKRADFAMVRVLPFAHQVLAHTYLDGGPTSSEDLAALRKEAQREMSVGDSLLQRITAGDESPVTALTSTTSAASPIPIRSATTADLAVVPLRLERQALDHKSGGAGTFHSRAPHAATRITSVERVLSVAVMLKSLNPDADVHVLTNNQAQLDVVAEWNAQRTRPVITALRYPDELFLKAPVTPVTETVEGDTTEPSRPMTSTGASLQGGLFIPN